MSVVNIIDAGDIGRGLAILSNKVVTDVPDPSILIPGASAPSNAVVQALLAAQSPAPLPGTLLKWIGNGSDQQPDVVYVVDENGSGVKVFGALRDVSGQSAFVINPTTGIVTWANGAVESTPIATLAITNPSAENALPLDVFVLHGIYVRLGASASPKTQTISAYSLVSFDNGGGALALLGAYPNVLGVSQLSALSTQSDVGAPNDAGNQPITTNLIRILVAAGATVTLRVQSQLNVRDGNVAGVAWSYCQLAARGKVQL